MVAQRIGYLRRDSVVGSARSEHLPCWGVTTVWVAALYHEVLDDTVEERAVVVALTGQFEEVVAVARRVVIEAYKDVALGSLDSYFCHVGRLLDMITVYKDTVFSLKNKGMARESHPFV